MINGKKIHVNQLASYSRKFTVCNTKKGISEKIDHPGIYGDLTNAITNPFTKHKFIPTNPHPTPSQRFGFTITGYDWIEPKKKLWTIPKEGFKQPKNLRKRKCGTYTKLCFTKEHGWIPQVVTYDHPSEFPMEKSFRLNEVQYMEKLVQHKLAKWERKNPKPKEMFTEEVEKWKQLRETAEQRLRDFVVSIYDKLHIIGNHIDYKSGKVVGKTVAEIKDVGGKGHDVSHPNLTESDTLYKNATNAARIAMNNNSAIVDCDLKNHKGDQKRPLIHAKRSKMKKAA